MDMFVHRKLLLQCKIITHGIMVEIRRPCAFPSSPWKYLGDNHMFQTIVGKVSLPHIDQACTGIPCHSLLYKDSGKFPKQPRKPQGDVSYCSSSNIVRCPSSMEIVEFSAVLKSQKVGFVRAVRIKHSIHPVVAVRGNGRLARQLSDSGLKSLQNHLIPHQCCSHH